MFVFDWFKKKQVAEVTENVTTEVKKAQTTPSVVVSGYDTTINDSTKKLQLLKIYKTFFNHRILDAIANQSEIVHNVYVSNPEMKYQQLDQFHYYYTDNLLELLQKYKKTCDENYKILKSQQEFILENVKNNDIKIEKLIKKYNSSNEKSQYARYIAIQLNTIYNCLVDNYQDFRFVELSSLQTYSNSDISNRALFHIIDEPLYNKITEINLDACYSFNGYFIQKRLMGILQKSYFNIEFVNVFKFNKKVIELFKDSETDKYFIFEVYSGVFQFVDFDLLSNLIDIKNTQLGIDINDHKAELNKLNKINIDLEDINIIDQQTNKTLQQYLDKINEQDFINENKLDIDIERSNLDAVIKLKRLDI